MKHFSLRRVGLIAAAVALMLAPPSSAGPGGGAITVTSVQSVDVTGLVIDAPCATVTASGFLHIVFHVTDLGNGKTRVVTVRHPQGITGVSTTGGEYAAGGSYAEVSIIPTGSAQVFSVASPFIFVGKAGAPTVKVTEVIQFTINAKGRATASVQYLNFSC